MPILTDRPSVATARREPPAPGAAARLLAHAYLRAVSARWRGDPEAAAFEPWLDGWWCPELPPAPPGPPAARSPHGSGGRGICWYEVAGEVRGYLPGTGGGYRVPGTALTPVQIDALFRSPDLGNTGVAGGAQPAQARSSERRTTMIGTLHPDEIEDLLYRHHVGHLACVADGHPYVVPITYAYADGCVYGHTLPGRKLSALRANPHACFEVDERWDERTWRSVVAEADYEELTDGPERAAALALLGGARPTVSPAPGGVVFWLRLTRTQGRLIRQVPAVSMVPGVATPLLGVDLRADDERNFPHRPGA